MNTKLFLPLALALPMFASCEKAAEAGETVQNAITEGADGLDLTALTPEAMKEKGTEMIGGLTSAIGGLTDKASIESFTKDWMPKLSQLSTLKDTLGDAMPSMDSLKGAVEGLTSKFGDNVELSGMIQPIIEKLKGLIG